MFSDIYQECGGAQNFSRHVKNGGSRSVGVGNGTDVPLVCAKKCQTQNACVCFVFPPSEDRAAVQTIRHREYLKKKMWKKKKKGVTRKYGELVFHYRIQNG